MAAARPWLDGALRRFAAEVAAGIGDDDAVMAELDRLASWNRRIHDDECINLNPATNVMNPAAERMLAAGLGSRPSLGTPGDKYEMGLEAIERIEVIAETLAAEVFGAAHAELRVASGAMANLMAFMASAEPGDAVIVPPAAIAGHVTHHAPGAAGLYRLAIHEAPVDADGYTVDVSGLAELADRVRPKLITLGGSLNLAPHPVAEVREIASSCGALLMFDAAHLCGMIAGGVWPNPLDQGAHMMTMSTYKSLGGPAGGMIVTNDARLAERLDAIAFPGLTANFDVGRVAALAVTLLDWRAHGRSYATEMAASATALTEALAAEGAPVFAPDGRATASHQFALAAARWGGGQAAAKHLRRGNILTCGIGLPIAAVEGDMNGLRFGTPEIVRRGMTAADMPELAGLIIRALGSDPERVAPEVSALRRRFAGFSFVR